jgi:hypothetical protein
VRKLRGHEIVIGALVASALWATFFVLTSGVTKVAKHWALVAPGITPLVALLAVWIAYRQLKLNRTNQRETTAKAAFREYLKLALQHPKLAAGNYHELVK